MCPPKVILERNILLYVHNHFTRTGHHKHFKIMHVYSVEDVNGI